MGSQVQISHQVSHLIKYEVLSNAVYIENLQCSKMQVKLKQVHFSTELIYYP